MKRLFSVMLIILLSGAGAWAADAVAEQTTTRLNEQARQMVAQGVPPDAAAKMQNRFNNQQMVQARNVIQAAKRKDVPVEPIVDKALEGIAKNVPGDKVVKAMEQVRSRYEAAMAEAKQLTRAKTRQQAVTRSMTHAMAAGMPPEDVAAIAEKVRSRERTMTRDEYEALAEETFAVAKDMARMGTPPKDLRNTLSMAMQNQFTPEQMSEMHSKFMSRSQNMPPDAVAKQFQAQMRAGENIGGKGPGSGSGSGGAGSGGSGSGGNGGGSGGGNGGGSGSGGGGGSGGGNGGGSGSGGGSGGGGKN